VLSFWLSGAERGESPSPAGKGSSSSSIYSRGTRPRAAKGDSGKPPRKNLTQKTPVKQGEQRGSVLRKKETAASRFDEQQKKFPFPRKDGGGLGSRGEAYPGHHQGQEREVPLGAWGSTVERKKKGARKRKIFLIPRGSVTKGVMLGIVPRNV